MDENVAHEQRSGRNLGTRYTHQEVGGRRFNFLNRYELLGGRTFGSPYTKQEVGGRRFWSLNRYEELGGGNFGLPLHRLAARWTEIWLMSSSADGIWAPVTRIRRSVDGDLAP